MYAVDPSDVDPANSGCTSCGPSAPRLIIRVTPFERAKSAPLGPFGSPVTGSPLKKNIVEPSADAPLYSGDEYCVGGLGVFGVRSSTCACAAAGPSNAAATAASAATSRIRAGCGARVGRTPFA